MRAVLLVLPIVFSIFFTSCKENAETVEVGSESMSFKEAEEANLSAGKLLRIENFPSEFIKPRNLDVWLPDDYSEDKKYAVLYMHDGQMLFDSTITWNKQEWMVDEIASRVLKEGKTRDFIVVAIWNISNIRWNDYFPEKAINYLNASQMDSINPIGGGEELQKSLNADEYLNFISSEVKPFIDKSFSTSPERESTFIAGSSMGGLISMYAMCEYPDIFGGAACISTHWPGAEPTENSPVGMAILSYMKEHLPDPDTHKFYFDFGTETLDQYYPAYEAQVNSIFSRAGYDETNFTNIRFEGADHSENSWNQRFDVPIKFLLGKQDE